jgi:hypothetical protein
LAYTTFGDGLVTYGPNIPSHTHTLNPNYWTDSTAYTDLVKQQLLVRVLREKEQESTVAEKDTVVYYRVYVFDPLDERDDPVFDGYCRASSPEKARIKAAIKANLPRDPDSYIYVANQIASGCK